DGIRDPLVTGVQTCALPIYPPPKVDSAVISFTSKGAEEQSDFLKFVRMCFRHKRKTLRNNLAEVYGELAGLPEAKMRAEQLSIEIGRASCRERAGKWVGAGP